MAMARDRYVKQSLGVLSQKIREARVLLVGAGGIGCELLKNLVCTGFGEIHIIDLDTIDLSNLNRQFLFRHEHIKKSKSIVAKEVAQKFNLNVKLVAHHANIKDAQFNVEWFSNFNLVFNALDNLDARRHVNKMCLAADVPLIESGTTGFNGQVQVIKKNVTACYDCSFKETPKTFPVCTIRSTPSQPIHCIVWAKSYLLPELFGVSEDEIQELDTTVDGDNAQEIGKLKEEAEALKKIRESMGSDDFAKMVFDKVFREDIDRLAKMEDMWKTRAAPQPLSYVDVAKDAESIESTIPGIDQRVWTLPEQFVVFNDSLTRLAKRIRAESEAAKPEMKNPIITFDKDDDDTLDFVAAASNLRSTIFGIEAKSKFDIKQMAGNIIPAIATTNAMIAGLCVLQSFKVLKGEYDRAKMAFLDRGKIGAGAADRPNPDCAVCGVTIARLQADLEKATLGDLVSGVLKEQLEYGDEISVLNGAGGVVFDADAEDNLVKKLSDLDIKDNSLVIVKDDADDEPRVDLHFIIEHKTAEGEGGKPVVLLLKEGEKLEVKRRTKDKSNINLPTADKVETVDTNGVSSANSVAKRKREADEDDDSAASKPVKKIQQNAPDQIEPILLDGEEEEGVISLD